jgi:hypothetical protein
MEGTMETGDILDRYRQYRALANEHHTRAISRVTTDTMLERARQIGLAAGRSFLLDEDDTEWALINDLALYTAPPGRSSAVGRYTKSAMSHTVGMDAQILRGMCNAIMSIWQVDRHHEQAGVILKDILRGGEVWLVDESFATVARPKWVGAMRLMPVEDFFINCGVLVPMDQVSLAGAVIDRLGWVRGNDLKRVADDPRFAIALYRVGLERGAMDRVRYHAVGDPLPGVGASAA